MRYAPLALLAVFAVVDLAANWRLLGMEPVSAQVWALGWPTRIGGGLVLLGLASHIALRWPYGPGL